MLIPFEFGLLFLYSIVTRNCGENYAGLYGIGLPYRFS